MYMKIFTIILISIFVIIHPSTCISEPLEDGNDGVLVLNGQILHGQNITWSEPIGILAKQYTGVTYTMNFMDFIEFCHQNGWQPAEVSSVEETQALIQYVNANFPDPKYFWLGGMDIGREGKYYWLASLTEFQYESWGPGYPNGGIEENCATIYGGDGSWYDQYCTSNGIWPLCQTQQ